MGGRVKFWRNGEKGGGRERGQSAETGHFLSVALVETVVDRAAGNTIHIEWILTLKGQESQQQRSRIKPASVSDHAPNLNLHA